jgi:hypothetical protein
VDNKEQYHILLSALLAGGVLGFFVGVARGIIQQKHGSIGGFIRGIVASILVAVLVTWGLAETAMTVTTQGMVTGVCSFIADDILLGLMSLGSLMGRDPLGFFSRVLSAYRGQSVQPVQPPVEAKPETKE